MALQKLLIDWPLTPYTGWGSYGIQLVQALLAGHGARPVLTCRADRSPHCEPHWLLRLDEVEHYSQGLIDYLRSKPEGVVDTNCRVVLESPCSNAWNRCSRTSQLTSSRSRSSQSSRS